MRNRISIAFIHLLLFQLTNIASYTVIYRASQVALMVKNLPAYAGDIRDVGWVPWSGRSPRGGHDNPLQCSCLENPMNRGAWWAVAYRVTKSWK